VRKHDAATDECRFCGKALPFDFNEAADAGWVPSFWEGQTEHLQPVCGDCLGRFVRIGSDGEVEMTAAGIYVLLQSRGPKIGRFN
jgi:hypothetical protein